MFEKLLVPVEFGPDSLNVVRLAKKIASEGATVRLVHVVSNETTMFFADMADQDRVARDVKAGMAELERHCRDANGIRIDAQIREGIVHKEILAECEEWRPDVIVAGSHGRRGLSRWMLGSVAESVLRGSSIPVCIVKGEVPEGKLGHVVLATDFSETTAQAEACFRRILEATGASGTVAHALNFDHWLAMATVPVPLAEGGYAVSAADREIQDRLEKLRSESEKNLGKTVAMFRDRELRVDGAMLEGEPWTVIADYVERDPSDLLVLGSHHYGAFDRFVIGSVAEKVLRSAQRPVLVVPQSNKEEE